MNHAVMEVQRIMRPTDAMLTQTERRNARKNPEVVSPLM